MTFTSIGFGKLYDQSENHFCPLRLQKGIVKNMNKDSVAASLEESGASSSCASPEQEVAPAESGGVKDSCIDRPDAVIRVQKVPRHKLYDPTLHGEDVLPIPNRIHRCYAPRDDKLGQRR